MEVLATLHYGLFNNPPAYTEFPDAEQEFLRQAKARDVTVLLSRDGESTNLVRSARRRPGGDPA